MPFIYSALIWSYRLLAILIAPWNPKARKWVEGRRGLMDRISQGLSKGKGPVIWMHCASLGEFEQGRPLLERLRKDHPGHRILLTFFSPSGYEVRKDYDVADLVTYLPLDTAEHAREFLELTRPVLALFVKYEFWHHYLSELRRRQVPTLLVSGIFRRGQPFFRSYGGFWRRMLGSFTHLFLQDQASLELLRGIGFGDRISRSGDTRCDRVVAIAREGGTVPGLVEFCGDHPVLVAGSTWEEDEDVICHYVNHREDLRTILAPHEPGPSQIKDIRRKFKDIILYSEWRSGQPFGAARVLVLDAMGLLARSYRQGTVAYVGGGFGEDGVHNVLEPAIFDIPVIIGPEYVKFKEAVDLIANGGALEIGSAVDFEQEMTRLLNDRESRTLAGKSAGDYVRERSGATDAIMAYIQEKRLLTS